MFGKFWIEHSKIDEWKYDFFVNDRISLVYFLVIFLFVTYHKSILSNDKNILSFYSSFDFSYLINIFFC